MMKKSYKIEDGKYTWRYDRYIRGPTRDIFAGVVEVILNEEGFKKTINVTLRDKNMLHCLSLTEDSDPETVIQKLKVNGLFESELKDYAAKATRDKLQDLGVYQKLKGEEKTKADDGQPLNTKDITFLFKIFEKIWKVQDDLWSSLRKVKIKRNDVAHEDMLLSPQDLEVNLDGCKSDLKKLLENVSKVYPHQTSTFDKLKSIIDDGIREIKERIREPLDPSSSQDYYVFRAEQKAFGPQATEHIQELSKEEIERKLIKHSRSVVCEWLALYGATDTSNIAVPLEVNMEKEFQGVNPRPVVNIIEQKLILKTKSPSGEEATVTILSGEAGAGKTTLLSSMTECWRKKQDQDFENLSLYAIVFYVEFRNLKFETLDQYLQEVLVDVVSAYDIQSVKEAIHKKPILFLCDGFDEKNDKSLNVFKEILDISWPTMKVLVTTRPIHTRELITLVNKSKKSRVNLNICPLTETSVIECMKKVVNLQLQNDTIKRKKTIAEMTDLYDSMTPDMKHIATIPLYAQLLATLLLNDPQLKTSIRTVTKLFLLLRDNEIKRLLDKCQGKLTENDVLKFLRVFNKRALINHLQNKHEISSDDIDAFKECLKYNPCFHDVMSSFFRIKHSLTRKEIYCYRHRTEQEFSAALAITDDIPNGFNMIRNSTEASIHYRMDKAYAFTAGILSESPENMRNNAMVFVKNLHSHYILPSMSFFAEVLSESHNNSDLINAISQTQCVKKSTWFLHNVRDLSGIKALFHRIIPEFIQLEFGFSFDPDTVIDLIPMIEAASLADVPIDLTFYKHLFERKDYSDKFLIKASKIIRSFTGYPSQMSIIPDNIQYLHLCPHLQQLPELNRILPKLTNLKGLDLHFFISDFSELPVRLSRETGTILHIRIYLGEGGGGGGGDTVAPRVASFLNSLWPENRKKTTAALESSQEGNSLAVHEDKEQFDHEDKGSMDRIWIYDPRITRDGIRTFIDSLDVGYLSMIVINDGSVDFTDTDRAELYRLAEEKGYGYVV